MAVAGLEHGAQRRLVLEHARHVRRRAQLHLAKRGAVDDPVLLGPLQRRVVRHAGHLDRHGHSTLRLAKCIGHQYGERLQRPVRIGRRQPVHRLARRERRLGQRLALGIEQRATGQLPDQEGQGVTVSVEGIRGFQQRAVADGKGFVLNGTGQGIHHRDLRGILRRLDRDPHLGRGRLELAVAHGERETVLPVEILDGHVAQVTAGTGELSVLRRVDHPVRQRRALDVRPGELNLHLTILRGDHHRLQRNRRGVDFLDLDQDLSDGLQFAIRDDHVETVNTRPLLLGRCPLDGGWRRFGEAHAVRRALKGVGQHAVGATVVVGRHGELQRFALEHLQRLDALDGRWGRVQHDHPTGNGAAGVAPAVLCLVTDDVRTGHAGIDLAARLHHGSQVALHEVGRRGSRFLIAAARLDLHRRLAAQGNNRAFRIHDANDPGHGLGLVANAILDQVLDGVVAGHLGVHSTVGDQPGGQVAVEVVRGLHARVGEFITGLRLQFRVADQLDHRRDMILDDDYADDLQRRVALRVLDVVRHLVGVRPVNVHRIGNNDAAGQVAVHPILGRGAGIGVLHAALHHDGGFADEADDRRAGVTNHDNPVRLGRRVPRRVGHVVKDDVLALLLHVNAVLHLHFASQVAIE